MARYKIVDSEGYHLQNYKVLPLLGITNSKLPKEGIEPREIQGVRNFKRGDRNAEAVRISVWVKPSTAGGSTNGSRPHRVVCACPGCGQEFSVGRLWQHVCDEVRK